MSKQPLNPAFLADLINNHRTGDEPGAAQHWEFDPKTCRDFGIRIGRDGTWYYHGTPIGRKPMCKLFSTVLRRDDAGNFYLVTPVPTIRFALSKMWKPVNRRHMYWFATIWRHLSCDRNFISWWK